MAKTTSNRKRLPPPATRRPPSARRPGPSRRPSRRPLALAALAVVAVVVLIAVLATRGGDDDGGDDVAAPEATAAALTGGDFHSLVADPTTPGRLFAGGHENVSASTDNGRTWSEIEGLRAADAMGWGFTGDAVYVSGHPGLNRSTDAARTFDRTNDGLPGTDVHAFGAGETVLYGAAAGAFSSVDGGATWTIVNADAGASFFGRILIDADDEQHLVAADARTGPVESLDGGRTWTPLDAGIPAARVSGTPDLEQLFASGSPRSGAQHRRRRHLGPAQAARRRVTRRARRRRRDPHRRRPPAASRRRPREPRRRSDLAAAVGATT